MERRRLEAFGNSVSDIASRRNGRCVLQITGQPEYGVLFGQDRIRPSFRATLAVEEKSPTIRSRHRRRSPCSLGGIRECHCAQRRDRIAASPLAVRKEFLFRGAWAWRLNSGTPNIPGHDFCRWSILSHRACRSTKSEECVMQYQESKSFSEWRGSLSFADIDAADYPKNTALTRQIQPRQKFPQFPGVHPSGPRSTSSVSV